MVKRGIATTNLATRFTVYSDLLRQLATDVPYVPLYNVEIGIALSKKFSFPDFSYDTLYTGAYALSIRPAS
jgi:peptide/nickel transport system substrate-binding protein